MKHSHAHLVPSWRFSVTTLYKRHTPSWVAICGYSLEPHRRGSSDKYPNRYFSSFAQNIDCEYSLEPPRRTPVRMLIILLSAFAQSCLNIEYYYPHSSKAVLTGTHNLCFWAEIRKIIYTPVNSTFTILKWGLRGSKLYRYIFVMYYYSHPRNLVRMLIILLSAFAQSCLNIEYYYPHSSNLTWMRIISAHWSGLTIRTLIWPEWGLHPIRISWPKRGITKTRLYKYIVNFTAERTKILRWKIVIFFLFLPKI